METNLGPSPGQSDHGILLGQDKLKGRHVTESELGRMDIKAPHNFVLFIRTSLQIQSYK